jgi:hypothetical protein
MASGTAPAEAARCSACRGVLETTLKFVEIEDVVARLVQLEERLGGIRS